MSTGDRRGFEDLDCHQLALGVLKEAYALAERLPTSERYNLADQMRRSAVSVTLNIAEGYGRYHYLDSLRFFYCARGSLTETLSAFVSCAAVGYIEDAELERLRQQTHTALRSLNGYIRYLRKQQRGHAEFGNQLHDDRPVFAASPSEAVVD
jgi:four helix bundle protein